ncbi:E3 ubiquitin-protein ligase RMA1H1-like [Rhodamnia argentea]|uniref:E3 ubiquitin-protein ligase RMA n=1 Tax=Rhodamnia argentea TaxID=178133 RepID=A0A8B8QIG5_9MYRT|nr:E3 ubiquitin-protein ligase RMA1H1-like [Rhodamnia argentea]
MALEHSFVDSMASQNPCEIRKPSFENWKSLAAATADSDDHHSGGFECNICLDMVQDPVVTLCGHLYCWPCIYKWLQVQSTNMENEEPQPQQCPVCKAEVSQATLVPLYGRGGSTKSAKSKARQLGIVIPKRPFGPACGVDSPRSLGAVSSPRSVQRVHNQGHTSYQSHLGNYPASPTINLGGASTSTVDPMIGMLGEMVYARVFGNSMTNMTTYPNSYQLAGSSSPRVRRHVMQADKSLSRICFFLFCCIILCLLLF